MTRADEHGQHDETSIDSIPEMPPVSPEPPNEAVQQLTTSPSVELKGERRLDMSFDEHPTKDDLDADVRAASKRIEDIVSVPTKLQNTLEGVNVWSRKICPGGLELT